MRNKFEIGRPAPGLGGRAVDAHPARPVPQPRRRHAERLDSDTDRAYSLRVSRRPRLRQPPRRSAPVRRSRARLRRGTGARRAGRVGQPGHPRADTATSTGTWRNVDSIVLPTLRPAAWRCSSAARPRAQQRRRRCQRPLRAPVRPAAGVARRSAATGTARPGSNSARSSRADAVDVPESQRFRAGGDDSVRGYAYRSLDADGRRRRRRRPRASPPAASRWRTRSAPSCRRVWWAAFVDAGRAAESWHGLDTRMGRRRGRALAQPGRPAARRRGLRRRGQAVAPAPVGRHCVLSR